MLDFISMLLEIGQSVVPCLREVLEAVVGALALDIAPEMFNRIIVGEYVGN